VSAIGCTAGGRRQKLLTTGAPAIRFSLKK
jgi:hypothetical protein